MGPGYILVPESTNGTRSKGGGKVQCKHCLKEFTGSASRIREHFVYSTPACGVSQCEKVPADVLALMQQEHAKRVKKDQVSAAKRALEWRPVRQQQQRQQQ